MKDKLTFGSLLLLALFLTIAPIILASERAERTASISGTQQPTVSLSATTLVFRYYPRCITGPLTRTVTLTNDGPGVLDISRIAITPQGPYPVFSQTNTCPGTLKVGDSCTITVTWHPSGPASGSLLVTDNGVGSPQSVYLRGQWLCLK